MNRVIAVTAALATAAMAGTVVATVVPAMAAPRPAAAHPAPRSTSGHSPTGTQTAMAVRAKSAAPGANVPPTVIGSELGGGKYVTVVSCQGVDSPPPITLAEPATPLIVNGAGPSAAILKMLQKPNPYTTVYTCTVTVKEKKMPAKPKAAVRTPRKQGCVIMVNGRAYGRSRCSKGVTLNTGFGGQAAQVKNHHPAG
jgi:hypothetical protein